MQKVRDFFKEPVFWCFGVICGLVMTLTKIVYPALPHSSQNNFDHLQNFASIENLVIFFISTLSFYIVINILNTIIKKRKKASNTRVSSAKRAIITTKTVFFIVFITSIMVFLIAFFTYYPGLGMNDTLASLQDFVSNNMHPPLFQAIVYGIFHSVQAITGSGNCGYAAITVLQVVAASTIIAYFIAWLHSHKLPTWVIVLAAIFLIGSPLIANYTIAVLKDTWFAYAILLLLPNLYDYIMSKTPSVINKALLLISLFGVWISRSNGKFIVLLVLLTLLIMFIKDKSKRILLAASVVAFLVLGFCVNQVVLNRIEQNTSFREAISIPLAQIGAVAKNDGKMSQEEKEFIGSILPLEKWKENYRFSFVDSIKFDNEFNNDFLNQHKSEFIKTWISIILKNPIASVKAYVFQTYGLWNLAYWDTENIDMTQSLFKNLRNNVPPSDDNSDDWSNWLNENRLSNHSLFSPGLTMFLDDYYQSTTSTSMYLSAGIMIVVCLGCIALLIVSKKYIRLVLFLPIFLSWGSMMIATPASMIYRYNFYLFLAIPFILIITVRSIQCGNGNPNLKTEQKVKKQIKTKSQNQKVRLSTSGG